MGQILKGTKKAFKNCEICHVNVPYKNKITIKLVLEKISHLPAILKYLPDKPQIHVTREYLFSIVNTLDQSFFMHAIEEIEARKLANGNQKTEQVIEIDQEMLKLMERLSDFNIGSSNMRSLANLKVGSKKRKRADVHREFILNAQVQVKNGLKQDYDINLEQTAKRRLFQ